jgi:hypothetical protein
LKCRVRLEAQRIHWRAQMLAQEHGKWGEADVEDSTMRVIEVLIDQLQ